MMKRNNCGVRSRKVKKIPKLPQRKLLGGEARGAEATVKRKLIISRC